MPSDLPRVSVSSVVGRTSTARMVASSIAVEVSASSESAVARTADDVGGPQQQQRGPRRRGPRTRRARRSRPRGSSSATASPVTRSSSPTPTVLLLMAREPTGARHPAAPTRPCGDGPRTRVTTWIWTPSWWRTGGSGSGWTSSSAGAGSTGAEADEILDRYQRVATHLSVVRSAAPGPQPGDLPVLPAGTSPDPVGGVPHHVLGRRPAVLHRDLPRGALPAAPLVAPHDARQRGGGTGAGLVVPARTRRSSQRSCPARRSSSWSRPTSRATTASSPRPLRRPGLDQQRLGRRAVHRRSGCSGCRWSTCCSRTSSTSR